MLSEPELLQMTTRRLSALYEADRILAVAPTIKDATPKILQALGESEGWQVGNLWLADPVHHVLRLEGTWHVAGREFPHFEVAGRELVVPEGHGVLGRVFATGKPIWLPDVSEDATFVRRRAAQLDGLRSAFSFPLWSLDRVVGIVELLSDQARAPDQSQIALVTSISQQLGQFVEYKQANVALRRSYAMLRTQLEGAVDGILIIDENQRIASYNQHFTEMWGLAPEIMALRDDRVILQQIQPLLCDPAAFNARVSWLYQHPLEAVRDEIRLKDGRIFERYSAPSISSTGEYYGRVWYFRDVTDRQRTEESLARLAAIVESSSDAIFSKTLDGTITSWNPGAERMYGYKADEIIGQSVACLFPPEEHAELDELMGRIARGEHILQYETVRLRKDGQRIDVSVNLSPMRDGAGNIIGAAAIARDISELKKTHAALSDTVRQLQENDRQKAIFINAVTHELKTPLTAMKGYLEFLEEGIGGELTEKEREFVLEIKRGEERLERLVMDLLDFARLEAGTLRLHPQEADLGEKVLEVIDSLQPLIVAGKINVIADLPDAPLKVTMDPQRIGQVLINLLSNAIKFTPPGNTITVRARYEGDHLRCDVSDTGIGIAPEDLPRLFQRFAQLKAGEGKGGVGLGLSISKSLVEAHGGTIGVESTPGRGSTFWFTLPRCADAAVSASSQAADQRAND